MTVDGDFEKVTRGSAEVVSEAELRSVLEKKADRRAYIGFEPSGLAHIGWLVQCQKVRDLQDANFTVVILLADWHAYINDKFGSNIEKIRVCAEYMKDVFAALELSNDRLEFVYATKLCDGIKYWEKVLRVSKATTLSRMKRALTVMGRKEEETEMDSSKLIYPAMQATDIFELKVDLALGGMDQRKAHMLARDAADKLGWKKFVGLHMPLLSSLSKSGRMDPLEVKMSKSKPDSAVLIHDTPEDIRRKFKKAYCTEGDIKDNPILEICQHVVFPRFGELTITRPEKWGGNMEFKSYQELAETFEKKELHPADLKTAVGEYVIKVLEPVAEYFSRHPENLEAVRGLTK